MRGVEVLRRAGGPEHLEIRAEGADVALEPEPKVPAVGAKLKRYRVLPRHRALRPQVIPVDLMGVVRQGLIVPDVLVQPSRCNTYIAKSHSDIFQYYLYYIMLDILQVFVNFDFGRNLSRNL